MIMKSMVGTGGGFKENSLSFFPTLVILRKSRKENDRLRTGIIAVSENFSVVSSVKNQEFFAWLA